MLIERTVFNFQEVGEKSLDDIKRECLEHFARNLKEALTSNQERVMNNFKIQEKSDEVIFSKRYRGSTLNYHAFELLANASLIKFNSKNIVFEEVLSNREGPYSVQGTCACSYGLEYVEEAGETSGYYRYLDNHECSCNDECSCLCECNNDKRPSAEEYLRNFNKAFGVGEFPFMTITIIRLGNKDHYFYNIHR